MIYENKYPNLVILVDTERVERIFRNQHRIWVRPTTRDERVRLVELLDADGFVPAWEHQSKEDVLDSIFPVSVNLADKTYVHAGNVTCAAAACTCKIVVSEREFYQMYHGGER